MRALTIRTTKRNLIDIVFVAVISLAAFYFYCVFRTLQETVGFHIYVSLRASLVLLFFLVPVCLLSLLIPKGKRRRILILIAVGWVLGCILGEAIILYDENEFRKEVNNYILTGEGEQYGRSRCWPNGTASLVYVKDRGIHATD